MMNHTMLQAQIEQQQLEKEAKEAQRFQQHQVSSGEQWGGAAVGDLVGDQQPVREPVREYGAGWADCVAFQADLASRKIEWERSKKEKEEKKRVSVMKRRNSSNGKLLTITRES